MGIPVENPASNPAAFAALGEALGLGPAAKADFAEPSVAAVGVDESQPVNSLGVAKAIEDRIRPKRQKWVFMADGQPANEAQRAVVNGLIANIAANHPDAHAVIYAGDIAHRANDPGKWLGQGWPISTYWNNEPILYDKILLDLEALPVSRGRLYTIPGNHDIDYGNRYSPTEWSYTTYSRTFGATNWVLRQGNLVVVLMGATTRATAGNIADYTAEWWREFVRENQDKNIFTVTHQPLQNTTAGSQTTGGSQVDSARFTSALTQPDGRVDVWFSGHTGADLCNPAVTSHGTFFGTCMVGLDMNSGVDDEGQPTVAGLGMSYVVVEFEDGSRDIHFTRWNATTNSIAKTWTVTVPHPLQLALEPEFDGRFQTDIRRPTIETPITQVVEVARQSDDGGITYVGPNRVNWIQRLILTDRYGNNVQTGSGPGILLYVPGSATNGGPSTVEPALNHTYGVGGGWALVKGRLTDNDYRAHAKLFASTSGPGEDSLVEVCEVEPDRWRMKIAMRFSAVFMDAWSVVAAGLTPGVQVAGNAASNSSLSIGRWSAGAGSAALVTVKSRAASPGLFAAVVNGDVLFDIIPTGDDGTANVETGRLRSQVDAVPAAGSVRAAWIVQTRDATGVADRFKIASDGGVTIHAAAGTAPTGGSMGAGSLNLAAGVYVTGSPVVGSDRSIYLRGYTVATLPSATPAGRLINVSDGTSNKRLAVSDGTNWRWPDGAIVS